jgi:hypothetical protein
MCIDSILAIIVLSCSLYYGGMVAIVWVLACLVIESCCSIQSLWLAIRMVIAWVSSLVAILG